MGRVQVNRLKYTPGEAGFPECAFHMGGRAQHVGGMLEDHRIAQEQVRHRKPERLPEREIPGHNGQNHAYGFKRIPGPLVR
ncbi:hypothetical protein D9M69_708170 [compost metagenome]